MWYQEWQSGYADILKRGYPRPQFKTTILAELQSPTVPDFLHGSTEDVPFLVATRTKKILQQHRLTGIRFSRVEIVKVATRGMKNRGTKRGEPEDQISKAGNRVSHVELPKLHAAYVIGRLDIIPDSPTGRVPGTRYVTPYDLPRRGTMPDLWRPTIKGRTFAAWVYCSHRFKEVVERNGLTNIRFEPFTEQMARFRQELYG